MTASNAVLEYCSMDETEKTIYVGAKIEEFRAMGILRCLHELSYKIVQLTKVTEASRNRIHLILTCNHCNRRIGLLENQ